MVIMLFSCVFHTDFASANTQTLGRKTQEIARNGIVHIEKGLLDVPKVPCLCDQMNILKQRVNVGDCNLYCEVEGNGGPLVLLHGGPGATHHLFHPSFSKAKDFAKTVYYDQRGCGLSDYKKGKGYSIEQAVDDLENLRQSLNISQWIVLGNSYGGLLAQCYAIKYPESVSGLVLVTSSIAMPVTMKPARQYKFISKEERERIRIIHSNGNLSPQQSLYNAWLNGDWKRQCYYKPSKEKIAQIALYEWKHDSNFNSIMSQDSQKVNLQGAFEGCPIPTMIMEGRWDLTWNTDKPSLLHKNHPNARLVFFEESGHGPFDDEPQKFFDTLRDFVVRLPEIPHKDLEQWKKYLVKWKRQNENLYSFLKTKMTKQEKTTIERFNSIKKKILEGEKYFNLSTPVEGLLSLISAVVSKDMNIYREIALTSKLNSFDQGLVDQYKNTYIYRIQELAKEPCEGDVHPVYIYVMDGEEKDFTGVEVFIYRQGEWKKLFNNPVLKPHWRNDVDWAKGLMK